MTHDTTGRDAPPILTRPAGSHESSLSATKRLHRGGGASHYEIRRRPTLPGGLPPSTIGAGGLNGRVRDGNGCDSAAMATGNLYFWLSIEGPRPPRTP